MRPIDQLSKLAHRFKQQLKVKATVSAQAGDVENALKAAKLWELSAGVAPLLNSAEVPGSAAVELQIILTAGPTVSFSAVLKPAEPGAAEKLSTLVGKKYSAIMSSALQKAGLDTEGTVTVPWLKY